MTIPEALDLDALEKLLGEATPGPWVTCDSGLLFTLRANGLINTFIQNGYEGEMLPADANLTCAIRNAAPALIGLARRALASTPAGQPDDEVKRLRRAAIEELERQSALCADQRERCRTPEDAGVFPYWDGRADAFKDAASVLRKLPATPTPGETE